MNDKKKCFVIMPFSKTYSLTKEQWTELFEHKIKFAVEESGFNYECERYEMRRANITKAILHQLNNAHVVIADLTSRNPNVLWELGVRHVLSNRTILIAQDKKFLPSDLKDYPIILYKYKQSPGEIEKFNQEIKDKLEDIEKNPDDPDSPAADFLQNKNIDLLSYEKAANLRKLDALLSEFSLNIDNIDKISAELRKLGLSSFRLQNVCIKLFLSTRYINPTPGLLDDISLCDSIVDLVNQELDLIHQSIMIDNEALAKDMATKIVPMRNNFTEILQSFADIRTDYANNNYQEPKEPIIKLASQEHEKYLKQLK